MVRSINRPHSRISFGTRPNLDCWLGTWLGTQTNNGRERSRIIHRAASCNAITSSSRFTNDRSSSYKTTSKGISFTVELRYTPARLPRLVITPRPVHHHALRPSSHRPRLVCGAGPRRLSPLPPPRRRDPRRCVEPVQRRRMGGCRRP